MRDPSSEVKADQVVGVSVEYTGSVEPLRNCGMVVMGDAGGVAIGDIRVDRLEALAALDNVEIVHAPRTVRAHLDTSVPEIHADIVRTGVPGYTGRGVIVGIVDTGIDILHKCFRKADGTTRILSIWDQTLVAATGESAPTGFGTLGVEFTTVQINAAIQASNESFRHQDVNGHGSHVAGIAAGNGSQSGNCHLANHYIGVATEADFIVVKALPDTNSANKSTDITKAVQYIFNRATALGKPVVVNMSLGHSTGAHDGTDPDDVFFDGLLTGTTGRAIVVSAGNDGDVGTADDIANGDYRNGVHASGNIAANATAPPIQFVIPPGDKTADYIDLRYSNAGQLQFTVADPAGNSLGPIAANAGAGTATVLGGNTVTVDAYTSATKRNQIGLTIAPPTGGATSSGQWTITLKEVSGHAVDYDFWIASSHTDPYPVFVFSQRVAMRTITIPGTAKNVITVAAYDSEAGTLAEFSSRGPTLAPDNRQKPDIAAPGRESAPASGIVAPKSKARGVFYCCDCCVDFYVNESGTSMSAPHVTGVVAMMLQKNSGLSFDQLRATIQTFSRDPGGGVAKPNNDWGYGKLDAQLATANIPPAPGGGGGGGGAITAEPIEPAIPTPIERFRLDSNEPVARAIFAPAALPIAKRLQGMIARNSENPSAQLLAALVSTHIDEVYQLIHGNRRVATMWHRMSGPAVMRSALVGSGPRIPAAPVIPACVSGNEVSRPLCRLLDLLGRYGSQRLRDDLSIYRPLILALPGSTMDDLWKQSLPTPLNKTAVTDGFANWNA
jgi:subtilisin family serine protease